MLTSKLPPTPGRKCCPLRPKHLKRYIDDRRPYKNYGVNERLRIYWLQGIKYQIGYEKFNLARNYFYWVWDAIIGL